MVLTRGCTAMQFAAVSADRMIGLDARRCRPTRSTATLQPSGARVEHGQANVIVRPPSADATYRGDGRRGWIRTSDLHHVMVTLCELSYPPAAAIQRNAGQSIGTVLVPVVARKKSPP